MSPGRHPKLFDEHVARLMSERDLDPESDDTDGLQKVLLDAECGSCDKYLACLFILVADGGRYQGLKRALDNQYLMDKDVYPENLPQALKLLEQFKSESFADIATGEPAADSGVAFAQTNSYSPTYFKCGVKGHTVNDCPKLDAAGWGNSGLTEKELKKQSKALPMLLLLTLLLLPQHLHPLQVSPV